MVPLYIVAVGECVVRHLCVLSLSLKPLGCHISSSSGLKLVLIKARRVNNKIVLIYDLTMERNADLE